MIATKFVSKIGGKTYSIVLMNIVVPTSFALPTKKHNIHVIDRSGSMLMHINKLIDQVQRAMSLAGPDDINSVIDFSGPGQSRVVLKGVKMSDDIKSFLDSMRSTISTTCFSEPLKKVHETILDLLPLCDVSNVTLFTDGDPVVPWGAVEDIRRSLEIVSQYGPSVISFNAVGFGRYYNQEFLKNLTSLSKFGVMTHSNNIEDYLQIYQKNYEAIGGMTVYPIHVKSQLPADILYTNNKLITLSDNQLDLDNIDKDSNKVYVIYEGKASNSIDIQVKDGVFEIDKIDDGIDPIEKENFFYAYASKLYYVGKRQMALDIIVNNIGDRYLADIIQSAFTVDEVAEAQNEIEKAFLMTGNRFQNGKTPPNYMPSKTAYCILDLLNDLQNTKAQYIPFSDEVDEYQRIGKKNTDNFNVFEMTKDRILAPVNDFIWNEDHLNLSIRYRVPGTVNLNPKTAKNVDLPSVFPSCIYRTHTIIKDGSVNLKNANFLVSEEMLQKLYASTHKFKDLGVVEEIDGRNMFSVVIYLEKIPVVNRSYMETSMEADSILKDVKQVVIWKTYQRVLKYYLDRTYEVGTINLQKEGAFASYNADQITVLQEHGISKAGVYGGIDNVKPSKDDCDSYISRLMNFQLKGSVTIPKVVDAFSKRDFNKNSTDQKKLKKFNFCESLMIEYDEKLNSLVTNNKLDMNVKNVALRDLLQKMLEEVQKEIRTIMFRLNIYKFATILNNDWIHGLVPDGSDAGKFLYTDGTDTMNVRVDRVVKYY